MESCGFDARKCGCFEGPNKVVHFLGKVLDLIIGRSIRCGCEVHPSPIVVIAGVVGAVLALVGVFSSAQKRLLARLGWLLALLRWPWVLRCLFGLAT